MPGEAGGELAIFSQGPEMGGIALSIRCVCAGPELVRLSAGSALLGVSS